MNLNAAKRCLLGAVLWPALVSAQVAVTTPIVGFDTLQVGGASGGGSQISFLGTEFLASVKHVGASSTVTTSSLSDSLASWTDDQFNGANGPHYLEITSLGGSTSAAGVGSTYLISDTIASSKTVTLATNLPAGLGTPVGYRIVKHWTLAGLFGATNTAGLQGGTSVTADHIQLWFGGTYESYYYQTAGIGGTGWRRVGNQSEDASGTIVRPDQSLIVKRGQAQDVAVTVIGEVKTGQTSVTVSPGFNFIPNPYSVAMTLASCNIYTGNPATGLAGGNIATADQLLAWNGTSYDTYYYQTSGIGGTGWRKVGDMTTDASATPIPALSSIIVRRTAPGAFTWVMPQHPASF